MNADDKRTLSEEMCKRWRGKFSANDLAYWGRELSDYPLATVLDAMTRYRANSTFRPKIGDIKKLLPARTSAADPKADEGSFADVLRKQNRQYDGRSDIEVYLRYHRNLWLCYSSGATGDGMRHQVESGCARCLVNAGMDEADAGKFAAYVFDPPDMFRLVLAEIRMQGQPDPFAAEAA